MLQAEEVACTENNCMHASPDPETGEERGLSLSRERRTKIARITEKHGTVSTFRVTESLPGTAVLILGIALASCRGTPDVILHPTEGNIQSVADPRFVLHEDSSDTLPYLDASSLEGVLIGREEGEPLEMIGRAMDFDISADGLYYVDFVYGHVRAYDFLGILTAVIGKRGGGARRIPIRATSVLYRDCGRPVTGCWCLITPYFGIQTEGGCLGAEKLFSYSP